MGLSVLISLLAGTALAGVVGAMVAVPTAALVAVFLDEYIVQKDSIPSGALSSGASLSGLHATPEATAKDAGEGNTPARPASS
jgi:hypothetical protein